MNLLRVLALFELWLPRFYSISARPLLKQDFQTQYVYSSGMCTLYTFLVNV